MLEKYRHKPFRPRARLVMTTPVHVLAFGGGAGLSPWVPGTFGTVVGVAVWWGLSMLPATAYLVAVGVLFGIGCWLCGRSAQLLGVHDHPGIVFDEVVGYLISAAPLVFATPARPGPLWAWLLAAFLLFRVFDILKPPPISWFDRNVKGGFGIMLDDALAALPVAALLYAAERFMPLVSG
ncbi:MAG: phosphatidylglycerophosphatase A [Nevskiaceae bacterium]|nr:MAG: phosphatidylglycerophosphatase A [Nevskiaceae bacterium]TBR74739.1 MAG: phosphatidylglycerophosphatase A [Nevskiaceae bacterium]